MNGDGTMVEKAYDSVNRPTGISHYTSTSGSLIAHYGYTYDSDGNVVMQTDSDGTITSYTYDGSNQLTGEMRGSGSGSNGYTESFTYDHNENRLTEDSNVGGTEVNSTYTYDNHDHLLTAGSKHYTYNVAGDSLSVTTFHVSTHCNAESFIFIIKFQMMSYN